MVGGWGGGDITKISREEKRGSHGKNSPLLIGRKSGWKGATDLNASMEKMVHRGGGKIKYRDENNLSLSEHQKKMVQGTEGKGQFPILEEGEARIHRSQGGGGNEIGERKPEDRDRALKKKKTF